MQDDRERARAENKNGVCGRYFYRQVIRYAGLEFGLYLINRRPNQTVSDFVHL
jgi:hypothetical protein